MESHRVMLSLRNCYKWIYPNEHGHEYRRQSSAKGTFKQTKKELKPPMQIWRSYENSGSLQVGRIREEWTISNRIP